MASSVAGLAALAVSQKMSTAVVEMSWAGRDPDAGSHDLDHSGVVLEGDLRFGTVVLRVAARLSDLQTAGSAPLGNS